MTIRSYKYRLYPTKTQERILFGWLKLNRELYNGALEDRRDSWQKRHTRVSKYDQIKQIGDICVECPEYNAVPSVVLRGTLRRLDHSFNAFFRRCKNGETPGYPRFKGRNHFNTISIDDIGKRSPIVAGGTRVHIPLLGKVKFKQHRPIEGTPKTIRIKYENGHWYISFCCVNVPKKILPATNKEVGIDLGINTLVACSDGEKIKNPRTLRKARLKLERAHRRVSKKKKGSKRRKKAVRHLAKAHYHVAQVRRQNLIDAANYLVQNHDVIYVEDLNIKGLAKSVLAKSVNDASWGSLLQWLNVKAESAGREIIAVDPRGTSQKCSGSDCGKVVKKDLSVRIHDCPHCGLVIDRDINAAINILALGQSVRRAALLVEKQL